VPKKGSSHVVSLLKSKSIFFKVSTKMMLSLLPVNEGLREQGALDYWFDDEGVGAGVWDMDPVVGHGERDWLPRPTQGLRRLGVDELDLMLVLAAPPLGRAGLQAPKIMLIDLLAC
jgi:hypothetical protein